MEDGLRGSEDLEVAETLSEPVRVKGEEMLGGAAEEEVFGEESEPAWGGAGGARVVWVRLKEEEAVLRAKPGSGDDEGVAALCKGVAGALTLPPAPPCVSARSVERHIFSSAWGLDFVSGFRTDGFLCKSWLPKTFWSFESLASGGALWTLERRDEGAVEGLAPRRRELPLRLETVRLAGSFSGRLPRDGATRLVLEMGTTRLMPWFSELLSVRTGLHLLAAAAAAAFAGFIPAGRVLEVGRFLVDDLDEVAGSAFPLVEEAVSVFSLVV